MSGQEKSGREPGRRALRVMSPESPGRTAGDGKTEVYRVDVSLESGSLRAAQSFDAPRLEVHPLPERPGVRVIGEVGLDTRTAWRDSLGRLARRDEALLHVELSEVTFMDVAGVTDLAVLAQSLAEGQRLMLYGPPPQVARVLSVFWPELGGIEVAR
jgi:anti-anti-sigma factor